LTFSSLKNSLNDIKPINYQKKKKEIRNKEINKNIEKKKKIV